MLNGTAACVGPMTFRPSCALPAFSRMTNKQTRRHVVSFQLSRGQADRVTALTRPHALNTAAAAAAAGRGFGRVTPHASPR